MTRTSWVELCERLGAIHEALEEHCDKGPLWLTYTSGCAYYGLTIDLDVAIPLKRHNRARQCGYISSVQNG